ncbi:MAG: DUF1800 domain-containing protein [Phycisphaeraceae bacterium]|nr:DUF1800 domain-containing protein [Phycisphaeraceae bacterium]MBX3367488.1 DUF1800 domain-containing protein [Phycisphaeraceae bacterium]
MLRSRQISDPPPGSDEPPVAAPDGPPADLHVEPEQAEERPRGPKPRIDPSSPIPDADFTPEHARHLLWRSGFGGTPEQIQTLAAWGPTRSVDYLLNVGDIPFDGVVTDLFKNDIMRSPTAEERAAARVAARSQDEESLARFRVMRQQAERADRLQIREVQEWWLSRMIQTPRPLEEKMTLFWHGHFATSYRTIENSYHMFRQNQLFRANALGNYGKLMYEIIRDPAMLAYLDNNDSRKGRPNENLARELMELFSLGVGNYTENDIREGARALTGYTFNENEFVFRRQDHDNGRKNILGRSGTLDGDGFVTAILEKRATSRFMARKLYRYFVADLPDREKDTDPVTRRYVDGIASTLASRRYELKPVLRQLFLSRRFYESEVMGQQIKSPVQLVVGAVRSLRTPVRDLGTLLDAMDLMGQSIFFPPSVKGWDGGRSWINTSTMYVRQNVLTFLLTGRKPRGRDAGASIEQYDPSRLVAEIAERDPAIRTDVEAMLRALARFVVGRDSESLIAPLRAYVAGATSGGAAPTDPRVLTGVLLLLTAAPEYQLN